MSGRPPTPGWPIARLASLALLVGALLVTAAPAAAAPVTFGSGQLEWGVKASFRNYIQTIAHGSYSASDGAEVTAPGGPIRFDILGGSYDDATGAGELTIDGTVRFEGHSGALDLTLRNLCATFAGGSGTLYADIASKDMSSGVMSTYTGVELVDLTSVPAPAPDGATGMEWASISTALNAAAAPAFANYSAGEEFDPLAPLTATFGTPRPRPSGGPCRTVGDGGGPGGGDTGGGDTGGGGSGGGGGGGGTTTPGTTPVVVPPVVKRAAKTVAVGRGRTARVATLRCGSARCRVKAPKSVRVKIAGKRYRVAVLAPAALGPRATARVRVRLSKAARRALAGRRTRVTIALAIRAEGVDTATKLKVTLKAKPAGKV